MIGDVVLAGNEFDPNEPAHYALVTAVSHRTVYEQTVVSYVDVDGNVETLKTTDNHEFYVENVGWVTAAELESGQALSLPDGSTATITSVVVESIPEGIEVYNFTVSDGATYFVDDGEGDVTPVWVY